MSAAPLRHPPLPAARQWRTNQTPSSLHRASPRSMSTRRTGGRHHGPSITSDKSVPHSSRPHARPRSSRCRRDTPRGPSSRTRTCAQSSRHLANRHRTRTGRSPHGKRRDQSSQCLRDSSAASSRHLRGRRSTGTCQRRSGHGPSNQRGMAASSSPGRCNRRHTRTRHARCTRHGRSNLEDNGGGRTLLPSSQPRTRMCGGPTQLARQGRSRPCPSTVHHL
mmetsp:Transcript_33201/g.87271  ORF Transcript_33201/g.87271 Transcript_33201/m.87271 type:complete len:221 (-) Transcript_33201:1568-2230(-)